MPTVDLFIMARERCPFSGMHLQRPITVKFGYADWDTQAVYEATKNLQVSASDTLAASLTKNLEKEIRHALAGVLRGVQIRALERGTPPAPGRCKACGTEPSQVKDGPFTVWEKVCPKCNLPFPARKPETPQVTALVRCNSCSHSKVERRELRCNHPIHAGVVARLPFDEGGNWRYVAGRAGAADCSAYPGERKDQ